MNDLEVVELEQKHLTAIFNKNQDILALHGQIQKATDDARRAAEDFKSLNDSLKEQIEVQRQELISDNKLIEVMKAREEKAAKKLAELGYEYADIVR